MGCLRRGVRSTLVAWYRVLRGRVPTPLLKGRSSLLDILVSLRNMQVVTYMNSGAS